MDSVEDLDARLMQSVRLLHAWGWMSELSTRPHEAMEALSEEARFLVRIGPKHPERWRQIGKLIVAYNKLIEKNKRRCQSMEEVG
jgi:hypothetical protein